MDEVLGWLRKGAVAFLGPVEVRQIFFLPDPKKESEQARRGVVVVTINYRGTLIRARQHECISVRHHLQYVQGRRAFDGRIIRPPLAGAFDAATIDTETHIVVLLPDDGHERFLMGGAGERNVRMRSRSGQRRLHAGVRVLSIERARQLSAQLG